MTLDERIATLHQELASATDLEDVLTAARRLDGALTVKYGTDVRCPSCNVGVGHFCRSSVTGEVVLHDSRQRASRR